MFGVSPAFIVSMFGSHFNVEQFYEALPIISELGYSGYQPEIFYKSELLRWQKEGAILVNQKANDLGLHPNQFVAHCLMENFSSPEKLFSLTDNDDLKIALEIVNYFPECKTIVIPIGPFTNVNQNLKTSKKNIYDSLKEALVNKISCYLELIEDAGVKFAIEVLPNSIVEGSDGFLQLANKVNSNNFGISLDTGHAWACRELIPFLPLKLQGKIFGLHLCDNDSNINKSLAPGKGTIAEEIMAEYTDAKKYLQRVLEKL